MALTPEEFAQMQADSQEIDNQLSSAQQTSNEKTGIANTPLTGASNVARGLGLNPVMDLLGVGQATAQEFGQKLMGKQKNVISITPEDLKSNPFIDWNRFNTISNPNMPMKQKVGDAATTASWILPGVSEVLPAARGVGPVLSNPAAEKAIQGLFQGLLQSAGSDLSRNQDINAGKAAVSAGVAAVTPLAIEKTGQLLSSAGQKLKPDLVKIAKEATNKFDDLLTKVVGKKYVSLTKELGIFDDAANKVDTENLTRFDGNVLQSGVEKIKTLLNKNGEDVRQMVTGQMAKIDDLSAKIDQHIEDARTLGDNASYNKLLKIRELFEKTVKEPATALSEGGKTSLVGDLGNVQTFKQTLASDFYGKDTKGIYSDVQKFIENNVVNNKELIQGANKQSSDLIGMKLMTEQALNSRKTFNLPVEKTQSAMRGMTPFFIANSILHNPALSLVIAAAMNPNVQKAAGTPMGLTAEALGKILSNPNVLQGSAPMAGNAVDALLKTEQ